MSMKNYSYSIGNRTRVFPACSAVPQPTAPPRASLGRFTLHKIIAVESNKEAMMYKYGCEMCLYLQGIVH